MSAVDLVAQAAQTIGYREEAIVRGYSFADILQPSPTTRHVPLAAFTRTPPSYRTAAFALITGRSDEAVELVHAHRSLGAPLLFVVDGNNVTLWQVRTAAPPRVLERISIDALPDLFSKNSEHWHPDVIHRAKSIGSVESNYQLDFVDLGLLPAIEGEIHVKLDRLLVEALSAAKDAWSTAERFDARLLFRVRISATRREGLAGSRSCISYQMEPR